MAGVAERLYYDSPELEFEAEVTDIRLNSESMDVNGVKLQLWQVALDRTAFYPEGGGQPWDRGFLIATAPSGTQLIAGVERVEEDEAGEVWHFIHKPLVAGTVIRGMVDSYRRMDHEQQHSGQHLLSFSFLHLLSAKTVSFHLGHESSTIDLVLPEGMEKISEQDLELVETHANRLIYSGRAIKPKWVSREEAEAMFARGDLRKLPEREGPMRIVEMEGVEFNACGGTHVKSTGAIGGLLLRKVEKAKKGWRVEFVCGQRAVQTARTDYEALKQTASLLTTGLKDVPGRVEALIDKAKATAKELKKAQSELKAHMLASEVKNPT